MDDKNIIIVTPFSDFGKLICDSLRDNSLGSASTMATCKEVADHVSTCPSLEYAMLDLEFGMPRVGEFVHLIRNKFPQASLILMSKKEPPAEAQEFAPWKLLSKPFVEGDLVELIKNPFEFKQSQVIEGKFTDQDAAASPEWLKDDLDLQANFLSAISNLDISEAFLYSPDKVLAQTRTITHTDITDCTWVLNRHLGDKQRGEVMKEVSLSSDRYLLHGTIMAVGIVLAILYHKETPYTIIRNQSRYLATRLMNPQLSVQGLLALPGRVADLKVDESTLEKLLVAEDKPLRVRLVHARPARRFKRTNPATDQQPVPKADPAPQAQHAEQARMETPAPQPNFAPPEPEYVADPDEEASVEPEVANPVAAPVPQPQAERVPAPTQRSEWVPALERVDPLAELRPVTSAQANPAARPHGFQTSPDIGHLNYACLLIPRFKNDLIVSDLARFLNEEIPNIFLAHGWRLENLIISSLYVQWVARMPASISPARHIKIIRQESSRMVLENFSRFSHNGLITDFWAPGHLLETGRQPIPEIEIAGFIQVNRLNYYPDEKVYQLRDVHYSHKD